MAFKIEDPGCAVPRHPAAKYGKNYFSQPGGSLLAKVTVDFRWEK